MGRFMSLMIHKSREIIAEEEAVVNGIEVFSTKLIMLYQA